MKRGIILFIVLLFVFGCVSSKQASNQDKPPGFIGKLFDNTVSRYNAYYNSSLIYNESISSATDGYKENYEELFATSVQDEVAENGSVGGQMDEIIDKTAKLIEKKPYSKWVDDHFLLNGIAHYIKKDYDMAEKIFRYVSSEYQDGIDEERVISRQKIRGVELAKQRRDEAKEKLKEAEEKREDIQKEIETEKVEREKEVRDIQKDRSKIAKSRKKRAKQLKKKNERMKRAAEEEADLRKKQGKEVDALEIVKEIKKQEREVEKSNEKITEKDRELLAKAPTLKQDPSKQKEGLLAHELAAKDALLWLAKTYITTEQYLSANAVLTAINEDEYFPERLNTDYYLTYADMHIQLDNKPKAIEYITLAAESSQRKDKGRLYFLLGQLYAANDQWDMAEEAYATVEKYHPYYDMIYHAKMNNIEHAYLEGEFVNQDFISPLKKMTKDAKNIEFLDEVNYFLGRAYEAKGDNEKAKEAFEISIDKLGNNNEIKKNAHLALATQYYNEKDFIKAQPNYQIASESISEATTEKETLTLYSENLKVINENIANIQLQDSLLQLAMLSPEEQLKITEKKVKKEIRDQFKKKLEEENDAFGDQSSTTLNNRRNRNRNNDITSNAFYFYDLQQATTGYSEFKQTWGDRPNVDNWRSSKITSRLNNRRNINTLSDNGEEDNLLTQEQRITYYIERIPNSIAQKEMANQSIFDSYVSLIAIFNNVFGDQVMTDFYTEELKKINLSNDFIQITETEDVIDSTPSSPSEIEKLYNEVFENYSAKNYEKAINLSKKAEQFQNNDFSDKFAYIHAMSMGQIQGEKVLVNELKDFIKKFPNSPLQEKAKALIQ